MPGRRAPAAAGQALPGGGAALVLARRRPGAGAVGRRGRLPPLGAPHEDRPECRCAEPAGAGPQCTHPGARVPRRPLGRRLRGGGGRVRPGGHRHPGRAVRRPDGPCMARPRARDQGPRRRHRPRGNQPRRRDWCRGRRVRACRAVQQPGPVRGSPDGSPARHRGLPRAGGPQLEPDRARRGSRTQRPSGPRDAGPPPAGPQGTGQRHQLGARHRGPGTRTDSATATRRGLRTARRSRTWTGPVSGPSWPAPTCSTASGCDEPTGAWTPATS